MDNEKIIPIIPAVSPIHETGDVPALVKKIGKTTYRVKVHFNDASTEDMSDKIKRMLRNEVQQKVS